MKRSNTKREFVKKTIAHFITEKDASILVCGSAKSERLILSDLGYENILFTGMDLRDQVNFNQESKFENVENLSFNNDSFDYALIKDTVHHTSLPHKVLTEVYRVSRKGCLIFEARDSLLIRLASRVGLSEQYEVAGNFEGHGVNGTDIPNYIFRWTEREVEKTIKSFAPHFNHHIEYRYYSNYPSGHGFQTLGKLMITLLKPFYLLFTSLFPKQQNIMAIFIAKPKIPDDLKPWVSYDKDKNKLTVDRIWIKNFYRKIHSR